jgi:hypothetical protein
LTGSQWEPDRDLYIGLVTRDLALREAGMDPSAATAEEACGAVLAEDPQRRVQAASQLENLYGAPLELRHPAIEPAYVCDSDLFATVEDGEAWRANGIDGAPLAEALSGMVFPADARFPGNMPSGLQACYQALVAP